LSYHCRRCRPADADRSEKPEARWLDQHHRRPWSGCFWWGNLADVFRCVAGVGLCLVARKGSRAKTTGLIPPIALPRL